MQPLNGALDSSHLPLSARCVNSMRAGEGATEDELVFGWHHRLNGREFVQTPGDGEGQESLVCCSPRGHKESDRTEQLNNRTTRTVLQRNTNNECSSQCHSRSEPGTGIWKV